MQYKQTDMATYCAKQHLEMERRKAVDHRDEDRYYWENKYVDESDSD